MWSTASEIDYIKGLGTFSESGKRMGRKQLLERYIASSQLRDKWTKVDRATVIDFAKKELDNIRE